GVAKDDRMAALARMVHLLGRATPPSAGRAALGARLAELLRAAYGAVERRVVRDGATAMVHAARARELSALLDAIGPALRAPSPERTAELLLLLLDRQAEPAAQPPPPQEVAATRRVLWVHLAQELLLTVGAPNAEVERRAERLLAQLDPEEYDAALPEVAALPAIRARSYVKGALAPVRREL